MKTPNKMTLTEYRIAQGEFNKTLWEGPGGLLRHIPCGTVIRTRTAYISVHNSPFPDSPCSGSGRCVPVDIPYCTQCELEPDQYGCLHSLPQPVAALPGSRAAQISPIPFQLLEPLASIPCSRWIKFKRTLRRLWIRVCGFGDSTDILADK